MKHVAFFALLSTLFFPITGRAQWHKIVYPGSSYYYNMEPVKNGAIIRPQEGHRGLFLSVDFGQTWKALDGPFELLNQPLTSGTRAMRYGSKDSMIIVDGTDMDGAGHCFLSRNLGATWTEIAPTPEGITTAPLVIHKGQAFTYGFFMYRYQEQLNRWDTLAVKRGRLLAQEDVIWRYNEGSLQDSLYKSADAGETWTATIPLSANRLIIRGDTMVTTYPFRRTFDGGAHWDDLPSVGPINELFDDGEYLYFSTDYKTCRSTDFFGTMEVLFDQQIYNVIRIDDAQLLVAGFLGCYRSVDNGLHWERSNTGIGPGDHGYVVEKIGDYLIAHYTIFGMTSNTQVQSFSTDNGRSWTGSVEYPFVYRLVKIGSDYFGAIGSNVYRSKNGVTNWTPLDFPGTADYSNLKLAVLNETLVVYGTRPDNFQCRLWLANTTVDPLVFQQVSMAVPFSPKGQVVHQNALYITDDFSIKKSVNAGQTWQNVGAPGYGGGLYSAGDRLYFIGFQGISYSVTGGGTWQLIPFPGNMIGQLQQVTVDTTAIYLLDAGSNIFYQNTGATGWDTLPGFPSGLGPGRIEVLGSHLFVPDYFGDIWTNDPTYVGTHFVNDPALLQVFPNPMEGSVTLQFAVNPQPGDALRIFGQNGTLVFEQRDLLQSQVLHVKNWPSGVYYFVWNAGARVFNKKMIKFE
jgi:hypothetical protein